MSDPILSFHDVSFGYDPARPVLEGISFSISPGEVVALVGRNGAGKSTLLRLVNGLLRPQSGRTEIAGAPAEGQKVSALARHIGTVFQAPEQQIFNASVETEIDFGPARLGLGPAEREARVKDSAALCGLSDVLALHPLDLDAARRRFVALASVLACGPQLLLLDEAQRGLDLRNRSRLSAIIKEQAAAGRAVLLVCHDMDFVAENAARVLALSAGRLSADLPVAEFFADDAATRAASAEQPGIVHLSRGLLGEVCLSPADFVARLRARIKS